MIWNGKKKIMLSNAIAEEKAKMESEKAKKTGTAPDFKGEGVAVWKNTTKEGKLYLSVQLFGSRGVKINCFRNEPRPTAVKEEQVL